MKMILTIDLSFKSFFKQHCKQTFPAYQLLGFSSEFLCFSFHVDSLLDKTSNLTTLSWASDFFWHFIEKKERKYVCNICNHLPGDISPKCGHFKI